MVMRWQTAVLLSKSASGLTFNSKDLSFRLRSVFRNVKAEWLRRVYVLMGHTKSDAEPLNIDQLVGSIVAHIVQASIQQPLNTASRAWH